MKVSKKIIQFTLLLLLLSPAVIYAQGLTDSTVIGCSGADCKFNHLLVLVEKFIDFILYGLIAPLSAVMFAVAGWKMMTAGDNPTHVQEAKTIFKYVAIGLIFSLASWLLVSAILDGLQVKDGGADPDYNLLK